jgi:hypothetical protein
MATRPVCNLEPKSGIKTVRNLSHSGQIRENDASQQLSSELVVGHPVASLPIKLGEYMTTLITLYFALPSIFMSAVTVRNIIFGDVV